MNIEDRLNHWAENKRGLGQLMGDSYIGDDSLKDDIKSAASLIAACRAAGFIGEDGKVRPPYDDEKLVDCIIDMGYVAVVGKAMERIAAQEAKREG